MKRLYTPVEDSKVISLKKRKINFSTFEEIKTKTTLLKSENTNFAYWKDFEKIKNINSATNSDIDSINELIRGLSGINIAREKLIDDMFLAKETTDKVKVKVKSKFKENKNHEINNNLIKPPLRKSLDDTKENKKSEISKALNISLSSIRTNKTAIAFEKRNIINFDDFTNSLTGNKEIKINTKFTHLKNELKQENEKKISKIENNDKILENKPLEKFQTPKFSNLNSTPIDKNENRKKNVFIPIPNLNFKKQISSNHGLAISNFDSNLNKSNKNNKNNNSILNKENKFPTMLFKK